jgi:hypothetical protein
VAIDQAQVGAVAAQLMDELEDTYGDDAWIENVALIVAVRHSGGSQTGVHFRFTEQTSTHAAIGLLEFASRALGPPPLS